MEAAKSVQKAGARRKVPDRSKRYSADFKLQIVKKYLEEGVPVSVIHQECAVAIGTVRRWMRAYHREGEAGLLPNYTAQKKGTGYFSNAIGKHLLFSRMWVFQFWDYYLIFIVLAYILVMRKISILYLKKYVSLYILCMWIVYFLSLHASYFHLTPKLNKIIFGYEIGLAGFKGEIEDFLMHLLLWSPLYIVITILFRARLKSMKWHILYFLFYCLINYTSWRVQFLFIP